MMEGGDNIDGGDDNGERGGSAMVMMVIKLHIIKNKKYNHKIILYFVLKLNKKSFQLHFYRTYFIFKFTI